MCKYEQSKYISSISDTDTKIIKNIENYIIPVEPMTQTNNSSNIKHYTPKSHTQDKHIFLASVKIIPDNYYQQYIQKTTVLPTNISTITNNTTFPI